MASSPKRFGSVGDFFAGLSLGTKGALAISIPVFALLLAMAFFFQFEAQTRDAELRVQHTFEVKSSIRQVVALLGDAETGTRGYLLTGRVDFLQPYLDARKGLGDAIAGLHSLVRDDPEQLQRVNTVESLIAGSLDAMEKVRHDADMTWSTGSPRLLESSKVHSDRVRVELDAMQKAEEEMLVRRNAGVAAAHRRLRLAIFAGGLFGLLGAIAAMLIFTKGISGRVKRLQDDALLVAKGLPIESWPRDGDEIADLGATLNDTSDVLTDQSQRLRAAHAELESRVEQRTSELAAANENLRQTNEVLEAVVRSSPVAITVLDLEGNVTIWNPGAERAFGWSTEEVLGLPLPIVPPDHDAEHAEWLRMFREGEVLSAVERKRRRRDGALIDSVIWTSPLRDYQGMIRGTVMIESDVSHQRVLEDEFRQSQKLEAVGRLAGGVAHDFNNLLTVIAGYAEMLVLEGQGTPKLVDYAGQILQAASRATSLTGQLLTFSRRQRTQPRIVNLNEIVANSLKLLRRVIGEDVEVVTHLDPSLGHVKADPVHLDQVIMNLVVNARDAMPAGGTLTIETADMLLDQEYAGRHLGVKPGLYCMLAISDTGVGMDIETRSRMFEPFFTTKEAGQGTGLGLSIVYGIIKQNDGEIIAYSEPGKGTSFKIYLPMVETPAGAVEAEAPAELARGNETIVVCEDEEVIRKLVRTMLERQGYRVIDFDSPQSVLDNIGKIKEPIHLLLTDVVLPQMSGFDLARAIRAMRPDIQIIYMSGYTDHRIRRSWKQDETTPFIEKPFTAAVLLQKIRDVLNNRTALI